MKELGLDGRFFIFQLFNFLVIFGGLYWLLHKPLLKILDDRKRAIKESLANAERLKKDVEESEIRQKEALAIARAEANKMLLDSKAQAKALEERLSADAKARAESILSRAEADILREREQMKKELKVEIAEMVVEASGRILGQKAGQEEQQEQIKQIANEL